MLEHLLRDQVVINDQNGLFHDETSRGRRSSQISNDRQARFCCTLLAGRSSCCRRSADIPVRSKARAPYRFTYVLKPFLPPTLLRTGMSALRADGSDEIGQRLGARTF